MQRKVSSGKEVRRWTLEYNDGEEPLNNRGVLWVRDWVILKTLLTARWSRRATGRAIYGLM